MTSPLLDRLASDEFTDAVGFVLPPAPLRRALQLSEDVRQLAAELRLDQVSKVDVREFVGRLLAVFRPGELFRHDVALAALAVAMESWPDSFAEEFLLDLARVHRPEFRASYRIARECLEARYASPKTKDDLACDSREEAVGVRQPVEEGKPVGE